MGKAESESSNSSVTLQGKKGVGREWSCTCMYFACVFGGEMGVWWYRVVIKELSLFSLGSFRVWMKMGNSRDSVALSRRSCNVGCGPAIGAELLVSMRWYGETQGRIVLREFGAGFSGYLERFKIWVCEILCNFPCQGAACHWSSILPLSRHTVPSKVLRIERIASCRSKRQV